MNNGNHPTYSTNTWTNKYVYNSTYQKLCISRWCNNSQKVFIDILLISKQLKKTCAQFCLPLFSSSCTGILVTIIILRENENCVCNFVPPLYFIIPTCISLYKWSSIICVCNFIAPIILDFNSKLNPQIKYDLSMHYITLLFQYNLNSPNSFCTKFDQKSNYARAQFKIVLFIK